MLPQPMTPTPTRFMQLSRCGDRRLANRRGAGRAPRRAIEIAQRHRRRAAHPDAVAPFAHDDVARRRRGSAAAAPATVSRSGAMKNSLVAIARPGDDHLGRREQGDQIGDGEAERLAGRREHADAALVARRGALQQRAPCRGPARSAASCSLPRSSASASASTDASEATSARRPPPLPGGAHHEVAEVGAEAVRAAEQFAVVQNAEAEAALDADDQKVVEVARLAEPVLGQRRPD